MNNTKIENLLNLHFGKWYEVCTLCTSSTNEKPEIIAKFLYKDDAVKFAENYSSAGTHTVIIR